MCIRDRYYSYQCSGRRNTGFEYYFEHPKFAEYVNDTFMKNYENCPIPTPYGGQLIFKEEITIFDYAAMCGDVVTTTKLLQKGAQPNIGLLKGLVMPEMPKDHPVRQILQMSLASE